MDLLVLLLEHRGQLVSRSEIVEQLWGKDVFVDVETGINTLVWKVRGALRDSPDAPRFVETVSGRGYRFLAPVEVVSDADPLPAHTGPGMPSASTDQTPSSASRIAAIPSGAPAPDRDASLEAATPWAGPAAPVAHTPAAHSRRRLQAGLAAVLLAAVTGTWIWLVGESAAPQMSIAVLPFANLGSDPERQYLADGLTEETSASLAQIDPERLSVKGRTIAYQGTSKGIAEIGRELSVDYLVERSIRAEGDRLRVTARLIRVTDQVHVWSQSFERDLVGLVGLPQELSTAIAEQIRVHLSPTRRETLARRHPRSADTYDLYLRGQHLANQRTPATTRRAVEYYERATALDPGYALAWSGRCPAPRRVAPRA
jgi:TolB-like protein/DNA-binding winged helix-turn-helix (wHTH) protein